jgi:hypothetical protein
LVQKLTAAHINGCQTASKFYDTPKQAVLHPLAFETKGIKMAGQIKWLEAERRNTFSELNLSQTAGVVNTYAFTAPVKHVFVITVKIFHFS